MLLRRRVLHALAKPTEGRWRMLRRRWRIDVLRWRWRIARLLVHGRASRLDYPRFSPAKFLDALVNDGQNAARPVSSRGRNAGRGGANSCSASARRAPPKGGESPAAPRPRNGNSASWQRQRNCAALPVALLVAGTPRGTCYSAPNICSSLPASISLRLNARMSGPVVGDAP